jgi:hypothetical protein
MKVNNLLPTIAIILLTSISIRTQAKEAHQEICDFVKKDQESSAYLIDENGAISQGPINFGRYAYSYEKRDYYYIPTKYRLILPSRIVVSKHSEGGVLHLEKTTQVCKTFSTYTISYTDSEAKSPESAASRTLPWQENSIPDLPAMQDPTSSSGWADIKYRFQLRVIGEIYKK